MKTNWFDWKRRLTCTSFVALTALVHGFLSLESRAAVVVVNFDNTIRATPVDRFDSLLPFVDLRSDNQWFATGYELYAFPNRSIPLTIGFEVLAQDVSMDFRSGELGAPLTVAVSGYRNDETVFSEIFTIGADGLRAQTFGLVDRIILARATGDTSLLLDNLSFGLTEDQFYASAIYRAKNLSGLGLIGWDFSQQDLTGANLSYSTLADASLSGANLTGTQLDDSILTDANLRGAVVTGASFGRQNFNGTGITQAQLQSTSNFQAKNLHGIGLEMNDLSSWDFSGQNLTNARLGGSKLTDTDLSGAVVTDADFSIRRISNELFFEYFGTGIATDQLYSTASYHAKNLAGITLEHNELTGADFSGQNLTRANLGFSTLNDADLSGANLTNASLSRASMENTSLIGANVVVVDFSGTNLSREQLYSTASYQAKNLQGIGLSGNDLTGWDLSGQNLTGAYFYYSILTSANLSGADLTGARLDAATLADANLEGAVVNWANFPSTYAQLKSTASFQAEDLQGIALWGIDLTGWDLSQQNLTNAALVSSALTNVNLIGASLKNAYLRGDSLSSAAFDSTTVYNQWTQFPDGFDPLAAGLSFVLSPSGDFDANELLELNDIDMLVTVINGRIPGTWLQYEMFDMNGDNTFNLDDHRVWVKDLKHTWFGDADLDGQFNSGDLIQVWAAGKYEAELDWFNRASWSAGDWNGDYKFTSADLVIALADGGYEQGPIASTAAVPEPAMFRVLLTGLIAAAGVPRSRRRAV